MNIASYVANLHEAYHTQLYESPWTCQALLRALDPLPQQYVIRLLYIDSPVSEGAWQARQQNAHSDQCLGAVQRGLACCSS